MRRCCWAYISGDISASAKASSSLNNNTASVEQISVGGTLQTLTGALFVPRNQFTYRAICMRNVILFPQIIFNSQQDSSCQAFYIVLCQVLHKCSEDVRGISSRYCALISVFKFHEHVLLSLSLSLSLFYIMHRPVFNLPHSAITFTVCPVDLFHVICLQ